MNALTSSSALNGVVSSAATSGAHEHEWVVRGVEFEDAGSVTRYTCGCGQVWFE